MNHTDFLPQWYVDRLVLRQYSRRNLVWALSLMAALGTLYTANVTRIRSASAALADYQEEQMKQEQIRLRMASLQGRKTVLDSEAELLSRIDDHAPVDLVMAEVASQLSDAMAIRSLKLERVEEDVKRTEGADTQSATNQKRTVTRVRLQGVSPSDVEIGMLYGRLSSSRLFEGVELHFTRETVESNREMRIFEISFRVVAVSLVNGFTEEINRG